MSSKRNYEKTSAQIVSFTGWKSALTGALTGAEDEIDSLPDSSKDRGKKQQSGDFLGDLFDRMNVSRADRTITSSTDGSPAQRKIRYHSMDYLWQMLFGNYRKLLDSFSQFYQNGLFGGGGMTLTQGSYYHEEETTSFSTTGTVKTSDGREFNFNLELSMSRSFTEAYFQSTTFPAPRFTDPLVINLDCDAADVTDQKFYFDLDADGHEEAISMLSGGSGFLALDKNGDGKINDGSELFGAASGNGFADLAKYDSDGNGWIDEADEIFKDLLIWTKDSNGNDRLIGLGEAGVGAIYLGSAQTEFSLNSLATNEANARIRSTGIFLYENGGMGTVQQLDLAQ